MQELKNYQADLQSKSERVIEVATKYPDTSIALEKFKMINETKVKTVTPEIMVYGIYNAGKSSILNEMMKEDRAKVNDVPETDTVTYYDWQGYKIADTPGVFAPIAHQEVTEEHLKKSDVVLFVMSTTGSFDRIENYERLKKIAEADKKIIIILNDKNGDLGKNDEAIRQIKQKVAVNMTKLGIENVDERYCIVTVNAKRAKLGREKNKVELYAKSGMDELTDVILSELKKTSSFEILRNAIRELEGNVNSMIETVKNLENSEVIRKMNEVLETFNKQKITMRQQINHFIDMRSQMLGETLPQIIWENRSNQSQIDTVITREIESLSKKVQEEISNQLKETASILQMEIESISEIKVSAQSEDAQSLKNVLENLSRINENITNEVAVAIPNEENKSNVTNLAAVNITANLAGESLKAIGKQLVKTEIGKTLAGTLIGKTLGGFIPVIGPIITVVSLLSTLGGLFGGEDDRKKIDAQLAQQNAQEIRRVEAEMQARQELNQKCMYMSDKIASELKRSADEGISETLTKYEEPFKQEIAQRKSEGEQVSGDLNNLVMIYNEYNQLRAELTSAIRS